MKPYTAAIALMVSISAAWALTTANQSIGQTSATRRGSDGLGEWPASAREMVDAVQWAQLAMSKAYGRDWREKGVPPKFGTEMGRLEKEMARLQACLRDLGRRAVAVRSSEDEGIAEGDAISAAERRMAQDEPRLIRLIDVHNAEMDRLRADGARHNAASPPENDAAAVAAYNREAEGLNSRGAELSEAGRKLMEQRSEMLAQKAGLRDRRAKLEEIQSVNRTERAAIRAETSQCDRDSRSAKIRAEALKAALAKSPKEGHPHR